MMRTFQEWNNLPYLDNLALKILAEGEAKEQEKKELPKFKDIIGLFVDDYEVGKLPGEQGEK